LLDLGHEGGASSHQLSGSGSTGAGTMLSMVAMIGSVIGKPLDETPVKAPVAVFGARSPAISATASAEVRAASPWNLATVAATSMIGRLRRNRTRMARTAAAARAACCAW
jgi:hypothetical protein